MEKVMRSSFWKVELENFRREVGDGSCQGSSLGEESEFYSM